MKKFLTFLTLLTLLACADERRASAPTDEVAAADTLPHLVMQIQKCSKLYTTEIKVHKIVTHDDVVRLKGNVLRQDFDIALPLGERKAAIPMDATLKAYIDFADFSEKNVERQGDHITILLPDPKVVLTSTKINQRDVKEYVGLVRSHFTDSELANYERQGRQAILNSIPDMGLVQTAQENAARVLVPLIAQLGYREENITIAFRKDLSIDKLINTTLEQKHE